MKTNYIIIIILATLLIGGAVAQVTLNKTDKTITISKESLDALKLETKATAISPDVSKIMCDGEQCWASIYQKDLIQTEWRVDKSYCASLITDINGTMNCKNYIDYTATELETMRNDFVKARLEGYAGNLIASKSKAGTQEVVGGGKLTFEEVKPK